MSSYSWIKLYHEVLHDPKMGKLPDNLWRRVIEIFLLAGEHGNSGSLPPIEDMAWILRLSKEELESDLLKLSEVNIAKQTPEGWQVVNFVKRQAAIETKDRMAAYRNRKKTQDYYEDETEDKQTSYEPVTNRHTDKNKSKNKNIEKIGAEKASRPRDELFDTIAQVCSVDPSTAGSTIAKVKVTLQKATPPYTPDDVRSFEKWWWNDDFRKKRGDPPTVWKLQEQIGIIRSNGNGKRDEPPSAPRKVYQ